VLVLDLVRNLEQHAAPVPVLARRAMGRPGGVARRDVERLGVLGFVAHADFDLFGEAQFGERAAEPALELGAQRLAVEAFGLFGGEFLGGATLHEQALDRVDRRQRPVARAQGCDLGGNPNQLGEKIVQHQRQREDQILLRLDL
jgi:hypothetical protein